MATKNLARSVIEGGRTKSNKWSRRNSHNEERAAARDFCQKVKLDPEIFDELSINEKTHVGKHFDDKLSPMYRWLKRQVGKSWDEVRSEVIKVFDTRTTAGRHIVYDHLLRSVDLTPKLNKYYGPDDLTSSYSDHNFYVDANGFLCKKEYIKRHIEQRPPFDTSKIANWLNGRIVGKIGDKFFWFIPVGKGKKYWKYPHIWKTHWAYAYNSSYYDKRSEGPKFAYLDYEVIYKKDSMGQPVIENGQRIELDRIPRWYSPFTPPPLRQDRQLNNEEMKFWNFLPNYYQIIILEFSPTYLKD